MRISVFTRRPFSPLSSGEGRSTFGAGAARVAGELVVKHNVQKERRICDTLEPVSQSHRLVVNADLVRRDFENCGTVAPGCVLLWHSRPRRRPRLCSTDRSKKIDEMISAFAGTRLD